MVAQQYKKLIKGKIEGQSPFMETSLPLPWVGFKRELRRGEASLIINSPSPC